MGRGAPTHPMASLPVNASVPRECGISVVSYISGARVAHIAVMLMIG